MVLITIDFLINVGKSKERRLIPVDNNEFGYQYNGGRVKGSCQKNF